MADEGEVICLDDSESDGEPQHRDMGVGTNDTQEDVEIVDSKKGILSKLDNVAITRTKKKEVGPSDRAFWGRGAEDSDEVEIVDTKEVKQTILEVRDAVVGTSETTGSGPKRVAKTAVKERNVSASSPEKESDASDSNSNQPVGAKLLGLHRNPSGQSTLNFGSKIRRNKGRQNSAERREGKTENVTELRMENIKSLLARAKPKKKNDNINISISKSAMKLSKNMNISISMVSGDKKERRSNSSLGNQSSSVICIDSSESDSEQRVEHSSRERPGRDGGVREKKVDRERARPDCGRESREEGEIVRERVYPSTVKERIKERKRSEVIHTRDRLRHGGVMAREHHEEQSESDRDKDPAVPGRERSRFEWDRGRAGGVRNVHRDFERRDWSHGKERDKKRVEDGYLKKRSPERENSFSPNKHLKILEKYSPPKQEKFSRQSRSSSRESSSRHASHSRSLKKKKKKRHRQRQSSSSSSSSSSSTSTSSKSSSSDADSSVVITKKRKKVHSRHGKRPMESTSEMAAKRLKRSSEQARETTSEKYIKQLKSSNLLKLAPRPEKTHRKPQEYSKKSTSELFLENMQKAVSPRTSSSSPPARRSSSSDSDHSESESRSVTSDQLFDRLLQEPARCRSYLSPIKMTDTGSSNASSDERLKTAVFKTVKVKEGVDAFLKSCQRILPPDEFNPVFKKVSKYMSNLSPMYLNNSSLKTFLDYKWALLDRDVKNVYIHVKDVLDELKKYKNDGSGTAGANSEVSDYPSTNSKKKNALTTITTEDESPHSPPDSPDVSGNELETVEKIINKSPVHIWSALEPNKDKDLVDSKNESDRRCSSEREENESVPVLIDRLETVNDMESLSNVEMSKGEFVEDENSNHSVCSNTNDQALFAFLDLKPKLAEVPPTDLPTILDLKPKPANDPPADLPAFLDLKPKAAEVPSTDLPKPADSGMKQDPVKKRVVLSTISNSVAKVRDISPVQKRKSSAEKQCFNMNLIEKDSHDAFDNDGCSDDKEDETIESEELGEDNDVKKGGKKGASERHIKKLEKALRSCSKQIQKHDEADIDWEKDDDSNFIMAAKLKKRYMAIYNKIAEYKGLSKSLDRRSDKKFTFTESKYPAINQKIEKFVNRTKSFPDFLDIRKEVEEVNVKRQLMLTDMQVHTEAERIFVIIGKKLKRRRNDDEGLVMYSYLKPDDQGDPAAKDRELERKLDELGKVAKDKIEKVFEDFVEKQVSKGKSGEDEGDDVDEDDEDEDEDREEPSSQLSIQSEEPSPVKQPTKTHKADKFKDSIVKPSAHDRKSETGESESSDGESLGHQDSDTDEHAEHEKEMEDILNYDPNKSMEGSSGSQPKFIRKDSSDLSRPGSAASRLSDGSVDNLLDDSDGEV